MKAIVKYLYDNNETIIIEINKNEYKFKIKNDDAIIEYKNSVNVIEATNLFNKLRPYISRVHTKNNEFYQEFDKVHTFKLPIDILQPSKMFIDEEILNKIDDDLDDNIIYFPVAIINDEYVLLDGHARLYKIKENYVKMVNVYIADYDEYIPDFVYICKEGNIKNIKNIHVLKHEEYELYWNQFLEQFNIE